MHKRPLLPDPAKVEIGTIFFFFSLSSSTPIRREFIQPLTAADFDSFGNWVSREGGRDPDHTIEAI
jgi:hypothetical protein